MTYNMSPRRAVKGSVIVEQLADRALENYEPMNMDFPDGDTMMIEHKVFEEDETWKMAFDAIHPHAENHILLHQKHSRI